MLDAISEFAPRGVIPRPAEHTTITADAVIELIARLIYPTRRQRSLTTRVDRMDAATALPVSVGE